MLKGKRVLTPNYFGTVMNNAEAEKVLILRAIRRRRVIDHGWDPVRCMAGAPRIESRWEVCDQEVAIPWESVGEIRISPRLPEWLYLRVIRRPRPLFLTTTVKGRTYIDW